MNFKQYIITCEISSINLSSHFFPSISYYFLQYLFFQIHDEDIKREFENSNSHRRAAFEDDFIRYADTMLVDVDKRIRKGRQRLSLSVKEALNNVTTGDVAVDEQIELLSERITGLVNEAERLGNEGNVEEAQGLSKLCDKLREERDQLRKAHENTVWHQVSLYLIFFLFC